MQVRPLVERDRAWLAKFIEERWGSRIVVGKGRVHEPRLLDGLVVDQDAKRLGALTYSFDKGECEIVTIDSELGESESGSALLEAMKKKAREFGCRRMWLITTNDNLPALRIYQKQGFHFVRENPGFTSSVFILMRWKGLGS